MHEGGCEEERVNRSNMGRGGARGVQAGEEALEDLVQQLGGKGGDRSHRRRGGQSQGARRISTRVAVIRRVGEVETVTLLPGMGSELTTAVRADHNAVSVNSRIAEELR